VDRRTSVLMKRLHDKSALDAEIEDDGKIFVENHYVGQLQGFRFTPDTHASGAQGKTARHAASKVLSQELARRADKLAAAKPETLALTRAGAIIWSTEEVARLEAGEDPLKPGIQLLADEHMNAPDREKVVARLRVWVDHHIAQRIKPLVDLAGASDVDGIARGIAFRLVENFGSLKREMVADEVRGLDQDARAGLRKYGVRFGAFNIFAPALMKPDAAELLLLLWGLKHGAQGGLDPYALPEMPRPGLTSVAADLALPEDFYRACGFHVCGGRAVRIDILERLGDQIRPLVSWKPGAEKAEPPAGALGGGAFKVQPDMMAILGCSQEELSGVLKALGYRVERRPVSNAHVAEAEAGAQTQQTPPVEAAQAEAAPQTEDGAQTQQTPPVEAAQAEAAPQTEDSTPSPETTPAAAADAVPAGELEYEEIWRPRRRPERRKRPRQTERVTQGEPQGAPGRVSQHNGADTRNAKPAHDKRGPKKKRAAPNKNQPKPAANAGKKQPPVDPDSPFAALKHLKEKMERDMQERA